MLTIQSPERVPSLIAELFAELRRVTQVLSSASGGDLVRAHVTTLRALSRLLEDVATQAALPPHAPVHLETLLAETIEQLTPLLEEQAVKIALERLCLHEPMVLADRERAQHLIVLLLGIVLEHCTPGDTITVSFRSSLRQLGVERRYRPCAHRPSPGPRRLAGRPALLAAGRPAFG